MPCLWISSVLVAFVFALLLRLPTRGAATTDFRPWILELFLKRFYLFIFRERGREEERERNICVREKH